VKDIPPRNERALILAPLGRDAVVAKGILRDAGIHSEICLDLGELVQEIKRGADIAVLTEEAARGFLTRVRSSSGYPPNHHGLIFP
jgi:hypothetical protein